MPATWKKLAFDTEVVKHSLATAANDFLVASGSGAFVKKTLAETQTLLGLPDDLWVLRDEFISSKANGDINGSSCEPGPGTRTLVDTTGLTIISGGKLVMPGDGVNDVLFTLDSFTRVVNRTLFTKININGYYAIAAGPFWWDGDALIQGLLFSPSGEIYANPGNKLVGEFELNTDYYVALSLQANGMKSYIKGGAYTVWTLLNDDGVSGANTPMYPGFYSFNAIGEQTTVEFLRVTDIQLYELIGLSAPDFLINQVFS